MKDGVTRTIKDWTSGQGALRKAGEFNAIEIDAIGARFTLKANGKLLGVFEDDTFPGGHQELEFASRGDALFEFDSYQISERVGG